MRKLQSECDPDANLEGRHHVDDLLEAHGDLAHGCEMLVPAPTSRTQKNWKAFRSLRRGRKKMPIRAVRAQFKRP